MKKLFIILVIGSLTFFSLTGCKTNEDAAETPPVNTVYIYDDSFTPATLTVSPNTEVTWVNKGSLDHAIESGLAAPTADRLTIQSERFGSAVLAPGVTYKHTFQWEGDWQYRCRIHTSMPIAKIKVVF